MKNLKTEKKNLSKCMLQYNEYYLLTKSRTKYNIEQK